MFMATAFLWDDRHEACIVLHYPWHPRPTPSSNTSALMDRWYSLCFLVSHTTAENRNIDRLGFETYPMSRPTLIPGILYVHCSHISQIIAYFNERHSIIAFWVNADCYFDQICGISFLYMIYYTANWSWRWQNIINYRHIEEIVGINKPVPLTFLARRHIVRWRTVVQCVEPFHVRSFRNFNNLLHFDTVIRKANVFQRPSTAHFANNPRKYQCLTNVKTTETGSR